MLIFNFLEKSVGRNSFSTTFLNVFEGKCFSCYILLTDQVSFDSLSGWLPLLLEILDNMCIEFICFPGCNVINFEVNLIFQN